MYLRDWSGQDAGSLKQQLEGLDGCLGTCCYLLNSVKLALLFSVVCNLGTKTDVEVRDELLMRGVCSHHRLSRNGHNRPKVFCEMTTEKSSS